MCQERIQRKSFLTSLICTVYAFIIAVNYPEVSSFDQHLKIGVLLGDTPEDEGMLLALQLAADYVNNSTDLLPDVKLEYVINRTDTSLSNSLDNIQHMCSLVQSGVAAVIAPVGSSVVRTTHPVTAGMHVPHLAPDATDPTLSQDVAQYPYLLKMSPPDWEQSKALAELARNYGWSRFGVLASLDDYGRNGLARFVQLASQYDWTISSFQYFLPSANLSSQEISQSLMDIKNKGARVIVLNCYGHQTRAIIDIALNLGMFRAGWAWLVTDGTTALPGLYDPCRDVPVYLYGLLGTSPASGRGDLFQTFSDLWGNVTSLSKQDTRDIEVGRADDNSSLDASICDNEEGTCEPCNPLTLGAYDMRTIDAVLAFAYGLHEYLDDNNTLHIPEFNTSVCSDPATQPWQDGELLFRYISQATGPGVASNVNFTAGLYPTFAGYDIVNLFEGGWNQVGEWISESQTNRSDDLTIDREVFFPGSVQTVPRDTVIDMSNVTLRIVSILEAPFIMETTPAERKVDPSKLYKGFCMDLLRMLQNSLKFNYTIQIVEDGNYGNQDDNTKEWNGMMGELVNRRVDVAVAPLTINYDRQQYVEFTKPYKDLGLTILMPKEKENSEALGFLRPFETQLWLAVIGAFIVCAIATTLCSYLSPYGYHGSYTQRQDKGDVSLRSTRHALRLIDSFWYTYASWMGQGADVSPRSLSGRFVHGVWWFAVMVISATYTANLAAFLTVRRLDSGINSLADLANQVDIHYGTVQNSAVTDFFETQVAEPYTKMSAFMDQMQSNVPNSSYGIEKVRYATKGDEFAFIFDSAPLIYAASNKPCTTRTVGDLFNQFGYGLAFPKNSPFVETFSLEILKLRENGSIEALDSRWISSGSCLSAVQETNTKGDQISLETMQGVFYFIVVGIGISFVLIVLEYCVASFRESRQKLASEQEPASMCSALGRRMRAVCQDIRNTCCCCCCTNRHNVNNHHSNNHHNDNHQSSKNHNTTQNGTSHTPTNNSNVDDTLTDLWIPRSDKYTNPAYADEIHRGDIIMKRRPEDMKYT